MQGNGINHLPRTNLVDPIRILTSNHPNRGSYLKDLFQIFYYSMFSFPFIQHAQCRCEKRPFVPEYRLDENYDIHSRILWPEVRCSVRE